MDEAGVRPSMLHQATCKDATLQMYRQSQLGPYSTSLPLHSLPLPSNFPHSPFLEQLNLIGGNRLVSQCINRVQSEAAAVCLRMRMSPLTATCMKTSMSWSMHMIIHLVPNTIRLLIISPTFPCPNLSHFSRTQSLSLSPPFPTLLSTGAV